MSAIFIFYSWDFFLTNFEGLNFSESYRKIVFILTGFFTVEIVRVRGILRISQKNNIYVIATLVPVLIELILIFLFININSNPFDIFLIKIISLSPVLLISFSYLKYTTLNILNLKIIRFSLLTIPNKLVNNSIGYLLNLFAFNLGVDFMAKFYSTLKVSSILDNILNAYYQYVEPKFYLNNGVTKKAFLKYIRETGLFSISYLVAVIILKSIFTSFELPKNISNEILLLITILHYTVGFYRIISFNLFFKLLNDIIFLFNTVSILIFMILAHFFPFYFIHSLILATIIKIFIVYLYSNINKKIDEPYINKVLV